MADYKKRKELKEYLPHEEHWKLKSDRKSVEKASTPAVTTLTATLDPNSAAALAEGGEAKLTTQTSEERKRSLSLMDTDTATPPPKKLNTENGESDEIEAEVPGNVGSNGDTAA